MADIFISYSQKDRAWVRRLVDALTAEGYNVWWDLEIRAGESFDHVIETALEKVKCVLVVWSEHSVKSEWVRAESAWAKDRDMLVSIRIDEDLELPLQFYHVQTDSMMGWEGTRDAPAFKNLVADISRMAGSPPAPAPAPTPTPTPAQVSGANAHLEPQTELEAPKKQQPSPASIATAAPRSETETSTEAGPQSTVPRPLPTSRRRGVIVGMVSVAVAALGSVIFYLVYPGALQPEMVVIRAGAFQMGCVSGKDCVPDELPNHIVTFEKPFAIGKYEVTFAEYDRFAEATGREGPDDVGWGRGRRPVINVSLVDALSYTKWLSEQTGKRFRLPTEAEWEYAARGGTTTPFSTGECIDTDQANYNGDYAWGKCPKTEVYRDETVEVGTLPANPKGLHEVHGNVWEWVQDCWHENYEGAPDDGSAWLRANSGACDRRVIRGGSWNYGPRYLRSAARDRNNAGSRYDLYGFRVAQDL